LVLRLSKAQAVQRSTCPDVRPPSWYNRGSVI
jgi:hypothetical protein